jgi:TPR repeat protein
MKIDGGCTVGRPLRVVALTVALALAAGTVAAAPEDDYTRGLQAYQRGDVVAAMSTLRAPAQAGHAASQALLAFILDGAGFADEAVRLYRDAAARGNAEGAAGLANMLLTGRGVAKDEKQAFVQFSKAADLGHALAIQVVADAYARGSMGQDAPARDNAAAQAALKRAAERGHLPAAQALADAYRSGNFGLAADAALAAQWEQRSAELRKKPAAGVANAK